MLHLHFTQSCRPHGTSCISVFMALKSRLQLLKIHCSNTRKPLSLSVLTKHLIRRKGVCLQWIRYIISDSSIMSKIRKRICVDSKKRITIHFWFSDEFERLISLLTTVNKVQPDAEIETFLFRKGGEISA